jgi:flagellar protein FlhE
MHAFKKTALMLGLLSAFIAEAKGLEESPSPYPVVLPESIANTRTPITDESARQQQKNAIVSAAASGAWAGSAFGPTVFQKGAWYATAAINPIGPVTNSNTTTTVNYSWSTSYRPTGLYVYLCNYARCTSISTYQSGSTSAFYGDSANSQFAFYFYVAGSGLLNPPIYGATNQVIVNYQ